MFRNLWVPRDFRTNGFVAATLLLDPIVLSVATVRAWTWVPRLGDVPCMFSQYQLRTSSIYIVCSLVGIAETSKWLVVTANHQYIQQTITAVQEERINVWIGKRETDVNDGHEFSILLFASNGCICKAVRPINEIGAAVPECNVFHLSERRFWKIILSYTSGNLRCDDV